MNALKNDEMIKWIRDIVNKHSISVYSLHKKTGMTQSAISRIVKGETKNPHRNNLNLLFETLFEQYGNGGSRDPKIIDLESEMIEINKSLDDCRSSILTNIETFVELTTQQKFDEKFVPMANEIRESLLSLFRRVLDVENDLKETKKRMDRHHPESDAG